MPATPARLPHFTPSRQGLPARTIYSLPAARASCADARGIYEIPALRRRPAARAHVVSDRTAG